MRDDLFEPLRTDQPVAEPLPAAEVRRRGDRLRRRRTTIQVVGAAVVVAFVAAGALTVADRSGGRESHEIERPKQTRTQPPAPRIRDDFPLGAGWPKATGDGFLEGPDRKADPIEWFHCGIGSLPPGSDRLNATLVEGSSGYTRELHTYPDIATASNAWATLRQEFESCPTWKDENGTPYTAQVDDLESGARFQVVQWSDVVFAGSVIVAREGSAVVVESAGTEGNGPEMARQVAAAQAAQLQPVLEAMCEFTPAGCPGGDPSHPSLADYPLTAGWPMADHTLERMHDGPEAYGLCGVTRDAVPDPVGFRGVTLHGNDTQDTRTRELWTFDTPAAAGEFLDTVERVSCRKVQHEDGVWRMGEVSRRAQGGAEVLTVTQWFERDGQPVSGNVEAAHVVQRGRAVLISYLSEQRSGRPGAEETAATGLAELGDALGALEGLS